MHGHKGPIAFFYEQGGSGETTVRYLTGNHVWGPYALETARDNVEAVVEQLDFEIGQTIN